jgi:hypothetical protein
MSRYIIAFLASFAFLCFVVALNWLADGQF